MMPDIDGLETLETIRKSYSLSELPVIMATARSGGDDVVAALQRGANDYITKPFDFGELVARIRALARRAQPAVPPALAVGDLVLDTATRKLTRRERSIDLSPKELACLEILLAASGRTAARARRSA